jgi:hypothetical protein
MVIIKKIRVKRKVRKNCSYIWYYNLMPDGLAFYSNRIEPTSIAHHLIFHKKRKIGFTGWCCELRRVICVGYSGCFAR